MMRYENSYVSWKTEVLGPTSIPVTILRNNIDVLVRPMTLILNQSFEQEFFPEILSLADSQKSRHCHF